MRYSQSEKMEIIRTVEDSEFGVKPTLRELQLSPSTSLRGFLTPV